MKRLSFILASIALLFSGMAAAQMTPAGNKALVVIRFNQPQVRYQQPLYNAISKAVATKQDVMFDLVSYAPATGNAPLDARWQETAGHNTRAIVAAMNQMGVPMSRITVSGQRQAGLNYDELHIFVR